MHRKIIETRDKWITEQYEEVKELQNKYDTHI